MNTYYTLFIGNDQLRHRAKGGCKKYRYHLSTYNKLLNELKTQNMSCQFHF